MRERLLEKKATLEKWIKSLTEALVITREGDEVDRMLAVSGRERAAGEVDQARKDLREVEAAIKRLMNPEGTFGVCEDCGDDISPARLNVVPETRYCIGCKQERESRGK